MQYEQDEINACSRYVESLLDELSDDQIDTLINGVIDGEFRRICKNRPLQHLFEGLVILSLSVYGKGRYDRLPDRYRTSN